MPLINSKIYVLLLTHQYALKIRKKDLALEPIKTKDKWRIRNFIRHPTDPGWEVGRYCLCHNQIRSAKNRNYRKIPTFIIDIVNVGKMRHVIRSMFKVTNVKPCQIYGKRGQRDLLFKNYYFAPKKGTGISYVQEILGLQNWKGAQSKKLKPENRPDKIVTRIMKNYEFRLKGTRPSTIHEDDWNLISSRANKERKMPRSRCHFCG